MAYITYDLTPDQIQKIANLCKQEQGTVEGAKAEASLAANILETQSYYKNKFGSDIYGFMRNSGWFSKAAYYMDNGSASQAYCDGIKAVLVNADRVLPQFVDEHDCFGDILSATNNGVAINIKDRSAYQKDVTVIKNRYGATYTFWCFPTTTSDPFGYTNSALRWKTDTTPSVKELLAKAISYLGVGEPTGDDQFIKYYNNITGAGFSLNVAWCAIFVSVIARMVDVSTDIIPTFADCDRGKAWFNNKGRYEPGAAYGGKYVPLAGDVVFYSSYYTQNDSTHVGYVVECDGNVLKAIEGNKNDKVGYRTIELTNKYILGYGRVSEYMSGNEDKELAVYVRNLYKTLLQRTPTDREVESWVNVMKNGATKEDVKNDFLNSEEYKNLHSNTESEQVKMVKKYQEWLKSYTGVPLYIDGDCGAITKETSVRAMQKFLNAEYYAGLVVDGKFGPKSQAAFKLIKKGVRGTNVYILQGLLYGHGYDPAGFDGSCGTGCDAAIRAFQKDHGLSVDGQCGAKTFATLIK